jgi:hypothetical protein
MLTILTISLGLAILITFEVSMGSFSDYDNDKSWGDYIEIVDSRDVISNCIKELKESKVVDCLDSEIFSAACLSEECMSLGINFYSEMSDNNENVLFILGDSDSKQINN